MNTTTRPLIGSADPLFRFRTEDEADLAAAELNTDDPDWTYMAVRFIGGGYVISVRDENGFFLGYL